MARTCVRCPMEAGYLLKFAGAINQTLSAPYCDACVLPVVGEHTGAFIERLEKPAPRRFLVWVEPKVLTASTALDAMVDYRRSVGDNSVTVRINPVDECA